VSENISPNSTLAHYRILSKLGAGGMGEVYLAEDTHLDRRVALKILPAEFASNTERMNRFVREAKSASALNHPNIITIHEIGVDGSTHFIASEYIEGETLHTRMRHEAPPLKSTLEIAIQMASALDAAHRAGIVHRDIKPENVIIRPDGLVKILDFGIAKLSEPIASESAEEAATAIKSEGTIPGIVIGTAHYMSPEQARGKTVDARSDIFSFGIVFYELLTGRRPFDGENAMDVMGAVLHKEPVPLSQLFPTLPPEIDRIVNKTLRKDREKRYQTAKDLLIDLKDANQELEFQDKKERTAAPQTPALTSLTARDTKPRTSSAEFITQEVKKHKLGVGLGSLILLALIAVGIWFFFFRPSTNSGTIDSIAVLPFQNKSSDADTEYLSDGLAESLIYRLSQLPNLKVSPTSSVFRYKGKDIDFNAIAGELGVSAVMTGRIAQRGDDLTISVELIDGRNNKLIWGEQYDRKMSDLLATQREIASTVTEKLQLKLSGEDAKGVVKRYTNNSEAYQLYLKGRHYWNKRTPDNIRKAMDQFKAAADKDPGFALAYVGLADAHMVLLYYTRTSGREVIPQAKAYATRALEIDESLAEAHASMGIINNLSWNWAESEKEFKRAIELNPNYATARHWYSRYLRTAGRFNEALTQIRQAHETDPLSLAINDNLAENLMEQGDLNSAIEQCKRSLELDPNYWAAHRTLASAYLKQGRNAEALVEAQKAVELLNNESVALKTLGYVQAVSGNRKEALAIVKELEQRYPKQQADGRDIAEVYAGLREKDQVFVWLEKDFQKHDHSLAQLRLEAGFDLVRDDPRFKDLLSRMGLTL